MCPCYLKIILNEENKRVPTLAFYYTCNSTNFWYKWNRTFIPVRFIAIPVSKTLLCLFCSNKTVVFLNFPLAAGVKNKRIFGFLLPKFWRFAESNTNLEGGPTQSHAGLPIRARQLPGGHMAPCQVEHPGRSYRRCGLPSPPLHCNYYLGPLRARLLSYPTAPAASSLSDPVGQCSSIP